MPSASYTPPRRIVDLEAAAAILRAEGLRFSASRRTVIEGLLRAEGPVSAEYLAAGLGGSASASDLPSAYRNLELFERLGLVRHVHIGHGPGLFALVGEPDRTYLVCERCNELGRLPGADREAIRARILKASGFEAHFTHFPILGLCRRCARLESERQASEGGTMSEHDNDEEHAHDEAHSHEHSHGGAAHSHPHDTHEHDHVEHEHEHSHGDRVHSHPHTHQDGLEGEHDHDHEE